MEMIVSLRKRESTIWPCSSTR